MDKPTTEIASYVRALQLSDLSESCRQAAELRIVDTFASAFGAAEAQPVLIAKRALGSDRSDGVAKLIGGGTGSVENAAFINSFASRYLDFNDWSPQGHGHPSDMILPLVAVGESINASGAQLLTALVAGYQAFVAVNLGGQIKTLGWDNGLAAAAGTAAGAAKLLDLDLDSIAAAIGIAICAGPALQARSSGAQLSMWKGGAGPNACRMGVFAALLAGAGMTGPTAVFESRGGVWDKVTGPFEVTAHLDTLSNPFAIEQTVVKQFPGEIHGQAPMAMAIELRSEIGSVDDIDALAITTYAKAKTAIAEPSRWHVDTRESADHSYPFMVATALLDGTVDLTSFETAKRQRAEVQALMNRITVEVDSNFTHFPAQFENEFTVTMSDGGVRRLRGSYPMGHPANPVAPEVHAGKVALLLDTYSDDGRAQAAVLSDRVGQLVELANVKELAALLAPE